MKATAGVSKLNEYNLITVLSVFIIYRGLCLSSKYFWTLQNKRFYLNTFQLYFCNFADGWPTCCKVKLKLDVEMSNLGNPSFCSHAPLRLCLDMQWHHCKAECRSLCASPCPVHIQHRTCWRETTETMLRALKLIKKQVRKSQGLIFKYTQNCLWFFHIKLWLHYRANWYLKTSEVHEAGTQYQLNKRAVFDQN